MEKSELELENERLRKALQISVFVFKQLEESLKLPEDMKMLELEYENGDTLSLEWGDVVSVFGLLAKGEPTPQDRIFTAIQTIFDLGSYDGAHHKQYTLDQVLRIISGDDYPDYVREWFASGGEWEEGIAP